MSKKLGTLSVTLVASTNPLLRGLKAAGSAIKKFTTSAMSMGQMIGLSIGGAAAIGGIKKMMTQMDKIGKSARNLGLTTTEYQKLDFAAQRSSISSDLVFQALRRVTTEGAKAATGSAESARAFGLLGISMEEIKKLSPGDLFDLVALKLNTATDKTSRNRAAVQLLGEQYSNLNNFLGDYKGLGDELQSSGAIIPDSAISAAEKFGDAMTNVSTILTAIVSKLGGFERLANAANLLTSTGSEISDAAGKTRGMRQIGSRDVAMSIIMDAIQAKGDPVDIALAHIARDMWINAAPNKIYTDSQMWGFNIIDEYARNLGLSAFAGDYKSSAWGLLGRSYRFGSNSGYRDQINGKWESVPFDPEIAEKNSKRNLMRRKLLEQYIRGTLPSGTMFHKMLANNDIPALWRMFGTEAVKYDNMLKEPVQSNPEMAASFARWDAIYSMEADFAAKQAAKENPAQAFIDAFVAKNGEISEEQRARLLALFGKMNPEKVAEIAKEKEFGTAGDFSAANLSRRLGNDVQERIAKATETTARESEKMSRALTEGNNQLTYI
jgi:hypothetical protein